MEFRKKERIRNEKGVDYEIDFSPQHSDKFWNMEMGSSERNCLSECSDCLLLKQSLSESKKKNLNLENKIKILSLQKSEFQKELSSLKSSYTDLTKNQENIDFEEILKRKDHEIRSMADELRKTQQLFNEISNEYDSFTMSVSHIDNLNDNDDYEYGRALKEKDEIIGEKDIALQKAQSLIKKLNEECEELSQQLFDIEQSKEQLQDSQVDDLRSTVGTLTQDFRKIKRKYKDLKASKWEQAENYEKTLKKVSEEKLLLETAVEELNKKFKEVEEMSTYRLGVFCNTYEKIEEAEEALQSKENELRDLKKYYEESEVSRQLEFISLKKSTEVIFANAKRQNQIEVNDHEEDETTPTAKTLPITRNLKLIIRELVLQDNKLRRDIYALIDREGDLIRQMLEEMDHKADNFRCDFEKWVMRNEEMEQRLIEVERNNLSLLKVTNDLKKIICAKDKQFDDVVRIYSRIGKEMQASIDFMSVELNDKHEFIVKDILPTSYQYFSKTLSDAHIQIFQKTHR